MDKRKLSKRPREMATPDMIEIAKRLGGMTHIVTANLFEDKKTLQLTFYEIDQLKQGKSEAAFRTFLSDSDYITQDLKASKVKWLTAAFDGMQGFSLWDCVWDSKKGERFWKENAFIRSEEEKKIIKEFFKQYGNPEDQHKPWDAIRRFQDKVKETRLSVKHKKETDRIDAAMEPIKDAPKEFFDWIWESGMSFSRYLIYKGEGEGKAVCECTHCKKIGAVDRKKIRLRNNEKGICPFCGSPVTIKAKGRMPAQIVDERWHLYVDPTEDGFALRYFKAVRRIKSDACIDADLNKDRVEQCAHEQRRAVCAFPGGKLKSAAYEWGAYKQRGNPRWSPDSGKMNCMDCVLYPGNLPQAWAHTPMKYSALEVLAKSLPSEPLCYERAMGKHLEFPKLEWLCKMGLHSLCKDIINDQGYFGNMTGKVNYEGGTIYEILGLTKVNVKTLQAVDGNHYMLRLLQAAQEVGIQFKPEGLREYYETFGCNTELLKRANRKASLHKLVKYIAKESERYPLEEEGGCWQYSDMGNAGCADSRIERMRNAAKDWLEYLGWCKKLKYDLDSMFVYMPNNFKKVHDRTYKEYQEQRDRIAAEEKKRREREAAQRMARARRVIRRVAYAVPAQGANAIMTAMCVQAAKGKLNFAGLDGHVLAWDQVDYEGEFELLIPKNTVEKLKSIGLSGETLIKRGKTGAAFITEEFEVYTRLIEGKYFKYQEMFKELPLHTVASKSAMLEAMTRAKMCTDEKRPVRFALAGKALNLSIKDSVTDYSETVELQEEMEKALTIGFDARLVLETLKAFDCENVRLSLDSPKMPMIVEAQEGDFKAIVLPVTMR